MMKISNKWMFCNFSNWNWTIDSQLHQIDHKYNGFNLLIGFGSEFYIDLYLAIIESTASNV